MKRMAADDDDAAAAAEPIAVSRSEEWWIDSGSDLRRKRLDRKAEDAAANDAHTR